MTFSPGAPHFQAEDKHVMRGLKTMPLEAEPDRHGEGKVGMRRGYFLIPAGLLWGGGHRCEAGSGGCEAADVPAKQE